MTHLDNLRRLAESLAWHLAGRPDADSFSAFGAPAAAGEELVYRAFVRCGDAGYWAHEERVPRADLEKLSPLKCHERQEQLQGEALDKLVGKLLAEVVRRGSP